MKKTRYIHCYGHVLNMCVKDVCSQVKCLKTTFGTGSEICKLVKLSPQRETHFKKVREESKNEKTGVHALDNNLFQCESSKLIMKHGVPQGSVLGPLLFLIYINDLHNSIKYCTVRHFADDTHLLISDASPKKLQKYINLDLKQLCKWLRANKISLNVSKTELLIFRHPLNKVNYGLKIKMNGKK